ncbi:MAG: hypothetical protein HZB67_05700 [Candidatus Aenigmarchaeota archaeon]|nr:hypothetical protein [Candidatus Aenigmarchaeota archaeon]
MGALFPQEKVYDEKWCKALLARHDPNVMKMGFDIVDNGVSVTKKNYTFYFTDAYFVTESVSILLYNGTVSGCEMEVISDVGAELFEPKTYSCPDETGFRLSSKATDDYLYVGKGMTYSLSSNAMKEAFKQINYTKEARGFMYVDIIKYRTPADGSDYEADVADSLSNAAGCEVNA